MGLGRRLTRLALMVAAFMAASILIVLLPGCAGWEHGQRGTRLTKIHGLDPSERRPVCHLRYHRCEWYGQQLDLSVWAAYEYHIGMHQRDYWGACRPEDLREIPPEPRPGEPEPITSMGGRRGKRKVSEP